MPREMDRREPGCGMDPPQHMGFPHIFSGGINGQL